jgi:four helix bundle protein
MKDFRELLVWEKAHRLTLDVYRVTQRFPREELYGLTSQLRRSCASIAANLAEGCCRATDADFARFVQTSMGSASETDYHLLLARDLGYVEPTEYQNLLGSVTEVKRMLAALLQALHKPIRATSSG